MANCLCQFGEIKNTSGCMAEEMFLGKFQERRKKHVEVGGPTGVSSRRKKKQLAERHFSRFPVTFLPLQCDFMLTTMLTLTAMSFLW